MNLFSEGEIRGAWQRSFTASQRGTLWMCWMKQLPLVGGWPRHCRKAIVPGSWPTVSSTLECLQAATTQIMPYLSLISKPYPGTSAVHHLEPLNLVILYQWINGGPEKGRNLPKSQAKHRKQKIYWNPTTQSSDILLEPVWAEGRVEGEHGLYPLKKIGREWRKKYGNLFHSSTF